MAVLALLAMANGVAAAERALPYDRLYVFGDSYSDTGAGHVEGNGPTAVWYLAQHMGLALQAPSFVQQRFPPDASLNFAVSAAATGHHDGFPLPGGALLAFGIGNQVDAFVAQAKSGAVRFDADRTLFFYAGGLNDQASTEEQVRSNVLASLEQLHGAGARHIRVARLPELVPFYSAVARRLNPVLAEVPALMRARHPDLDIRISQWGAHFDTVLRHPRDYGLEDTVSLCAGYRVFRWEVRPCDTPDRYFYYRVGHPSRAAHRIVGGLLYAELLGEPPFSSGPPR